MKKSIITLLLILLPPALFAQQSISAPQKFALVIGNGAYTELGPLVNPVNDAADMAAVLGDMGFKVTTVLNGSLDQIENAILRLKNDLSVSRDAYGFFFYAGHGVQSNGENYLIPVDANIPSENFLRSRAVSVQMMLNELNDARNSLNVIVLDACRDNPFSWSRSGTRGLAIVSNQPADSIIVYATSAGQRASDGQGRNGLFTSQLLHNLSEPGLEVAEIFRRTGADVSRESNRQQVPAIYNQFFGIAYLGNVPEGAAAVKSSPRPTSTQPVKNTSNGKTDKDTHLWSIGASVGSTFTAPLFMGTLHGTISPFKYSFLELGLDFGMGCVLDEVDYHSFYPFAHYAVFFPVLPWASLYAGAGFGYMLAKYNFPTGDVTANDLGINAIAGINIRDFLDISYTLRVNPNLKGISNKVSAGYTYRFK